ncbi:hypothetical protein G6L26_005640 [Agrobacterium radiobacter]|uniref:Uncharacterized protein n=1 Tax=Agrobacterium tumefaciens str. B6 TaxID=1183423 RepID=A0A822UXZ1_AGRTU|nr:hypothetical protein [Agrobacterium tumefaciens]KWT81575.1 hypothetical protein ASB65_15755 [Agrobacterium tumefaciens str. B6]MQB27090.1 hypothetical protein [Agrobacterium tumefaciens]NTA04686.1 hypothetical protein [Agrobacterium tumefaciens]NTA91278.1 hypothetical protein [Agrobacterium tumefaciens]NTB12427.1 hypothetical protein [Agrobacterium tumefaciens]
MQRIVDWSLPFIFVISVTGVLLASPDPLARDTLCELTNICLRLRNQTFWNPLIYEFGLGASVSIAFYWLLVKLPQTSKRKRLRSYLRGSYRAFRREVTLQFLFAAEQKPIALDTLDTLISQADFRAYFKQPSIDVDGDKWHDVQNHITARNLQDIGVATTIFRDDMAYVLNNSDVVDQRSFEMLQRLTKASSHWNFLSADYDDQKSLFGFYWHVMAGWDPVYGYPKEDPILRMIGQI